MKLCLAETGTEMRNICLSIDRSGLMLKAEHTHSRMQSHLTLCLIQPHPCAESNACRCVGLEQAPRYLRRNFIKSGYYIGARILCPSLRTRLDCPHNAC